jgi:hypothetical protein
MTDNLRTDLAAKFSLRAVSRATLGCLLGVALLATGAPARAADDDADNNVPIDTKIFRGIMESLGLQRGGNSINYQERAPLVLPPSRALPPPERSDAALANNAAWPKDPDVQRQKLEATQERNTSMNPDEMIQSEASPLRPNQIAPGPKPRTKRVGDDGYRAPATGYDSQISPSKLGTRGSIFSSMFGKDDPDSGSFTGEPPRSSLTEPPPGYQTPSPDQPYGIGKTKTVAPTSTDYARDHPVGSQ